MVLSLDGVSKRFGAFTAVDELSFAVPEGGVFGFLGGNGAGKTTCLRMALDIIRPTSGTIEILGRPPGRANAAALGFLPEERGLYRRMSVIDIIVYFGRLKAMTAHDARRSALELIDRLGLGPWARTPVDKLSKGMSQKVQVAAAVVNAPRLILFDEPFSGLDPVNQTVLEELMMEMARSGVTVVFSTHVMQHAERLCDRLVMLAAGRKAFEGSLSEARRTLPSKLSMAAKADPAALPGVVGTKRLAQGADGWSDWEVELAPSLDPQALLEMCTQRSFALRRFEARQPTLHEVFIHLVGANEGRSS